MKLVICDNQKKQTFSIPKKIENIYMIHFQYFYNNSSYDETLTLKAIDGEWALTKEEKLSIYIDGEECSAVALRENTKLELLFANLPERVSVYIYPDFLSYLFYSLEDKKKISIGSEDNSTIKFPSSIKESVTLINNNGVWYVQRTNMQEKNTFLNDVSYGVGLLKSGDVLFIHGIKIVFMKNYIMLNPFQYQLFINGLVELSCNTDTIPELLPVSDIEKNVKLFNENQLFVHSPRMRNEIQEETVEIEDPPQKDNSQNTPVLFTLISSSAIFATSSLTLLTSIRNYSRGQTETFAFMVELATCGVMIVTSIILPFLTEKWNRHTKKRTERLRNKKYKAYLKEKEKYIDEVIKKQEEILKFNNTSISQIKTNIGNASNEIWSREIFDNDFLNVVIGTGNIPAQIKIQAPKTRFSLNQDKLKDQAIALSTKKTELTSVPVTFSILKEQVMPVIINSKNSTEYVMSILLQLIYYHSGADLKIITITSEEQEKKWEFIKFLPHSWDSKRERRFFASNEDELQQISSFLEQEYNARNTHGSVSDADKKYLEYPEYYLIVTDNYKLAREMPITNHILEEEANYGFSLVIFENSFQNLPSRFEKMVNISEKEGTVVNKNSQGSKNLLFIPNQDLDIEIEKYAKILSNIPLSIAGVDANIPSHVNFLELFNAGKVDQLNILSRWKENNPTTSLKAIIGYKENNKSIELDLHEKYHGPHGLIAGSTGSGKSEFIISYILSLAVNYHPYEVQFVLIDYKGGGLAGAFENRDKGIKLPHLVGTITNLDKSEMNRTLVSINSELQRRQRVFNETRERLDEGTIDIYKYQRLYRDGKVDKPMAHLFIISDEFAELKEQQPEFMDELVSAARIGRSLGIHLILATQKPAGVVDDQIWSNARFRVCLKVQTPEDSSEMLKKPDAAYIKEAGRFYLQVGSDEIYELGQSGWSGAKYIPSDNVQKKIDDSIEFLSNNGENIKKVNEVVVKEEVQEQGDQLTNLVRYLYNLAIRENISFSNLWLPNIPENIYYDNIIKKYNLQLNPHFIDPIIGEYDNPAEQKQGYVDLPLSTCGNTFITGISGSGKSTLLSTIIYSIIINYNVDVVNIYIIDLGAEKLKIFSKAPQVGEVLTGADTDRIKFLFYMLKDEKDKRFAYYAQKGGDFTKDLKMGSHVFPTILVIINDFDVFKEQFERLYEEEFGPFTRNCTKVGIIFIVTSTMVNALGYMCENNFQKRIALNLTESSDYGMLFDNAPVPKKNPGRGIIMLDKLYEFQTSLIFEDEVLDRQLNYIVSQLNKYLVKKAPRVPVIPDEVTVGWLKNRIKSLATFPLGVNIKTAQTGIFNFDKLLTVMLSESNVTAKKFFPKLMELFLCLENLRIIVINSIEDLNLVMPEGVKYCDTGFKSIIQTISSNVDKCLKEPKEAQFMVVFLGYSALQKHLTKAKEEDATVITIDDLVQKSKTISNFRYVFYDNVRQIKTIEEGALDAEFKRNTGIWLGKNFEDQSVFETIQYYSSDNITNNNIVLVKNGKAEFLKF